MKSKITMAAIATIVVGGAALLWVNRDQQPSADSAKLTASTESTHGTTESTVAIAPRTTTLTKKVQIYVDPKLYSTEYESDNDYVIVRDKADNNGKKVVSVHRGEFADYIEENGNWVKIKASTGEEGWIPKANAKISEVSLKSAPNDLSQVTVLLDPGHGGEDTGAETTDGTVNEKNLTLKTAQAVGAKLAAAGIQVSYTRTEDKFLKLTEISAINQKTDADIFLSFHYDNYDYPNGNHGSTTYYYYDRDEKLANTINQALVTDLPLKYNNGVRFGNYLVMRESYSPSLLLELGYINSDQDLPKITSADFPDQVATAILKGIEQYYGLPKTDAN